MNYKLKYRQLVSKARARVLPADTYVEVHHILPRCMGGPDCDSNLVALTPEEHYHAHLLLAKIHPDHKGLLQACVVMCLGRKRINNKLYGWIKRKRYITGRTVQECETCGCEFSIHKCLSDNGRKYCSKKCHSKAQVVELIDIKCKCCGNVFSLIPWKAKGRKYCSPKCSVNDNKKLIKKCCNCGESFKCYPSAPFRKFCSKSCSYAGRKPGSGRSKARSNNLSSHVQ